MEQAVFDVVLIEGDDDIRYGIVPSCEMDGGTAPHLSGMSRNDALALAASLSDLTVLQSSWSDIPI